MTFIERHILAKNYFPLSGVTPKYLLYVLL